MNLTHHSFCLNSATYFPSSGLLELSPAFRRGAGPEFEVDEISVLASAIVGNVRRSVVFSSFWLVCACVHACVRELRS